MKAPARGRAPEASDHAVPSGRGVGGHHDAPADAEVLGRAELGQKADQREVVAEPGALALRALLGA